MKFGDGSSSCVKINLKDLSQGDIDKLVADWLPSEKQLSRAMHSTIKKVSRWANAVAIKKIRADTGIPAGMLRQRIKLFRRGHTNRIYFGLNPISVISLDPKQTKTGISAKGGIKIPGAFIAESSASGSDCVFKRRGRNAYSIEYQRIYFDQEARRVIDVDIMPYIQGKFNKILEHELKWQMSK
ncbi:hypothetical protein D0S45_17405 [Marinifilum sp. JC120]|nr:hypothetical protein D0S45_17405 [Marinifilum sp. JC120]